jgi:hypothetical protein
MHCRLFSPVSVTKKHVYDRVAVFWPIQFQLSGICTIEPHTREVPRSKSLDQVLRIPLCSATKKNRVYILRMKQRKKVEVLNISLQTSGSLNMNLYTANHTTQALP